MGISPDAGQFVNASFPPLLHQSSYYRRQKIKIKKENSPIQPLERLRNFFVLIELVFAKTWTVLKT